MQQFAPPTYRGPSASAGSLLIALAGLLSPCAWSLTGAEQAQVERQRLIEQRRQQGLAVGSPVEEARAALRRVRAQATAASYIRPDGLPSELFQGCEQSGEGANTAPAQGRDSQESVTPKVDPISERVFASLSLNELENDADLKNHCWFRLDGVWVEFAKPEFDSNFQSHGWQGSKSGGLAHGVYTRPEYLIVESSQNPDHSLTISNPFKGERLALDALDPTPLAQVLKVGGPSKRYKSRGSGPTLRFGRVLEIKVSRSGYVHLRLGDKLFMRPRPAISKSARDNQIEDSDSFNRASTLVNLEAVRKGYDVTTQNPTRFLNNPKQEVFAKHGARDYYVENQRIIPLGLYRKLDTEQGMAHFSSLLSSASEMQSAYSSSYGNSNKIGVSGSASKGPDASNNRSVNVDLSVGWGASHSNEAFNALSRERSVAQAVGYSRFKEYALVREYAFSSLNLHFQDAVHEAVATGNYQELIRRYGTHYPYAVTYGSQGQLVHNTTKEGFFQVESKASNSSSNTSANLLIYQHESNSSRSNNTRESFSESTEYGTAYFDAVGGNGSWNENGFSAGQTPYPILLDLRPLDELLNAMNFPGEPEVYLQGRLGLAEALDAHVAAAAATVRTASLKPMPSEQRQRWRVHMVSLKCFAAGAHEGRGKPVQIAGKVNVRFAGMSAPIMKAWNSSKSGHYELPCNKTRRNTEPVAARLQEFEGTLAQLKKLRYKLDMFLEEIDWFLDAADGREIINRKPSGWFSLPLHKNLQPGQVFRWHYKVPHPPGYPDLRVEFLVRRLK